MAYTIVDNALDAAINYILNNLSKAYICSEEPETVEEANDTYMLAEMDITSYDITGPSAGDPDGRAFTIGQLACDSADATGTGTYLALYSDLGELSLVVPLSSSIAVTASKPLILLSITVTFRDPEAA